MLDNRDFGFALALHLLVILSFFIANQWRTSPVKPPEQVIKINMVSLQELQAMMPKPVQPKEQPKLAPAIAKPTPTAVKAKPVLHPTKKVVKKKVKKSTPAKHVEEELDYDPFAPLESTRHKPRKKKTSGKKALDEMLSKQLSDEELAKYISGMQKAVEQQWKVPIEMINSVQNALVELHLFRNGNVKRVRILESSGSTTLDQSLSQAIYAAAPFHIPEQQFELFKSNTIRFYPLK